ncbi:MAG: hypothetical protein ACK5DN_01745, partial [Hyphomonadaceae bacterium]
RQECTTATTVVFVFTVSTWNAFAAGCAYAKAYVEFERARWGVKRHASGASAKPIAPLDASARADRSVGRLQGKRSDAYSRSK